MEKLRNFAEAYFREYNSQGSRTATNIVEMEAQEDRVVYQYDYTSLQGITTRLSKVFRLDKDGEISHEGPVRVD